MAHDKSISQDDNGSHTESAEVVLLRQVDQLVAEILRTAGEDGEKSTSAQKGIRNHKVAQAKLREQSNAIVESSINF